MTADGRPRIEIESNVAHPAPPQHDIQTIPTITTMKNTRFASFAIGGLALGLSLLSLTGCQDSPTDTTSTTATTTTDQLYTIYKFDQSALTGEDLLPTFDEAMAGGVLTEDGGLMLPPPGGDDNGGRGRGGDDTTHTGGGRDTLNHGGGRGGDDTTHTGGGRDTVNHGGGRDTLNHGGGRGGDDHGRDSVRRDPPRRDSAILNVHNIERLLRSLPGMNDSLLRTVAPCFRDYRASVDAVKRRFNNAIHELRAQFNRDARALRNDSTLTNDEKRAQFNTLKQQFQAAAADLKTSLDAAMRDALAELLNCIGQYLNAEQLAAFRAGIELLH